MLIKLAEWREGFVYELKIKKLVGADEVFFPAEVDIAGFDPENRKASELELNEIIGLIEKSERPVLYVGGGIISADASDALRRFVAETGIPVTSTIMGVGAFPETHELSLRWLGMHGSAYANWAVSDKEEGASIFKPGTSPTGPFTDDDLTDSGAFVKSIVLGWDAPPTE